MKKSILKTLHSTIQGDVFSQKEFKKFYSVDASSYQIIPKVVVVPKNEKDVINAVKIAKKIKTSITVRGAGTGLVGSALNNGIILEMKNFDSIIVPSFRIKPIHKLCLYAVYSCFNHIS